MVEISSFIGFHTKPRRWRIFLVDPAAESLSKFVLIFCVALTVPGGYPSSVVNAGESGRLHAPKPSVQSVECGPYAVCDLASHFCDKVMNTCVRCSDDCHPGRINGDTLAEEDCKRKCKVYYEKNEENDRLVAMETTTPTPTAKSIVNQYESNEKYLQLSVRSLNLINTADDLTLTRLELLMVIETISLAVITFLLFIISICLIILLQRQRVRTVYSSYSPLDTDRKTASG